MGLWGFSEWIQVKCLQQFLAQNKRSFNISPSTPVFSPLTLPSSFSFFYLFLLYIVFKSTNIYIYFYISLFSFHICSSLLSSQSELQLWYWGFWSRFLRLEFKWGTVLVLVTEHLPDSCLKTPVSYALALLFFPLSRPWKTNPASNTWVKLLNVSSKEQDSEELHTLY